MDAPTIRLAGLEVILDPVSPFDATGLLMVGRDSSDSIVYLALTFAALGLGWPKKAPTVAGWPARWRLGQPLPEYGRAIYDALIHAGEKGSTICEAARTAHEWALTGLPADEEIRAVGESSEAGSAATSET